MIGLFYALSVCQKGLTSSDQTRSLLKRAEKRPLKTVAGLQRKNLKALSSIRNLQYLTILALDVHERRGFVQTNALTIINIRRIEQNIDPAPNLSKTKVL